MIQVYLNRMPKNLLNALNDLGIPVQVASIRTTDVRVDKMGKNFIFMEKIILDIEKETNLHFKKIKMII